jgi:hypothetical protein
MNCVLFKNWGAPVASIAGQEHLTRFPSGLIAVLIAGI